MRWVFKVQLSFDVLQKIRTKSFSSWRLRKSLKLSDHSFLQLNSAPAKYNPLWKSWHNKRGFWGPRFRMPPNVPWTLIIQQILHKADANHHRRRRENLPCLSLTLAQTSASPLGEWGLRFSASTYLALYMLSSWYALFLFEGLWLVKQLQIELSYLNIKEAESLKRTNRKWLPIWSKYDVGRETILKWDFSDSTGNAFCKIKSDPHLEW